jgi:hypothetical protein
MPRKTKKASRPRPRTLARDFRRALEVVIDDCEGGMVGKNTKAHLRVSIARGLRPFWLALIDILERCIPYCRPLESDDYRIEAVFEIEDAIDAVLICFPPGAWSSHWLYFPKEVGRLLGLLAVTRCLGKLGSREAIAIQNHTYRLIAADLPGVRRAVLGRPQGDLWAEMTRHLRDAL